MGWNGWAIRDGKDANIDIAVDLKPVFLVANEKLRACSGWMGVLESGEIEGYASKILLEKATGQSCDQKRQDTDFPEWTPEMVQKFHQIANWHMTFEDVPEEAFRYFNDPWIGFWQARIFLEMCALNCLGMRFSG